MKGYDILFLSLSAVALTLGVGVGLTMAATHDFALMPVHAHLNLLGSTCLALFGLNHRSYPALANQRLSQCMRLLPCLEPYFCLRVSGWL